MSNQYRTEQRNIVCDVETDDVSDSACNSLLTTNFSVYHGYGQIEADSGRFLTSEGVLRPRGAILHSHPTSPSTIKDMHLTGNTQGRVYDSNILSDPGYDTMSSYTQRQSFNSNNGDGTILDIHNLQIKSLSEDVVPPPIPLQELPPDSRADSLCEKFGHTHISHIDSKLDSVQSKYSSGFVSGQALSSCDSHMRDSDSIHHSGSSTQRSVLDSGFSSRSYHSHKSGRLPSTPSTTRPSVIHEHATPGGLEPVRRQTLSPPPPSSPPADLVLPPQEELFAQNEDLDTILHFAIYTENQELFSSIFSRVTHLRWLNIQNNQLQSALHLAVIQNQPHNVRRLVSWGASIDVRDRHGNTPLHLACDRLRVECVIALTTALGRSDVKEVPYTVPFQRMPQEMNLLNYAGKSCLHLAAEKAFLLPEYNPEQKNYITIVHHLLNKCSADINVKEGKAGETILHQAVQANHVKLAQYLLLSRHIDVNSVRYDGKTPYQLAMAMGLRDMQRVLLRHGAYESYDVNEDDEDESMDVDAAVDRLTPEKLVPHSRESEFGYDDIKIGGQLLGR